MCTCGLWDNIAVVLLYLILRSQIILGGKNSMPPMGHEFISTIDQLGPTSRVGMNLFTIQATNRFPKIVV